MQKKVLITGAAKRIGAACARLLHGEGCNVFLHYRSYSETFYPGAWQAWLTGTVWFPSTIGFIGAC